MIDAYSLDKRGLIDLVSGSAPDYSQFKWLSKYGSFDDYRGWSWNISTLYELTEKELYTLYWDIRTNNNFY